VSARLDRLLRSLAAAALLLWAAPATADAYLDDWHPYQTYWSVGWEAAFPVGSLQNNWIANPAWLGGAFDIRVGVVGRLSVGVGGSWNWFAQTFPQVTVVEPQVTVTAPVYRRLSTFTLRGTAHYYLTQTAVQPYVGIGVGVVWAETLRQAVNRKDGESTTALALAPEAGFLFNVVPRVALYVAGRYQFTLADFANVKHAQWITAQAGLAWYF
jgi:opacity protein-like surface antigen